MATSVGSNIHIYKPSIPPSQPKIERPIFTSPFGTSSSQKVGTQETSPIQINFKPVDQMNSNFLPPTQLNSSSNSGYISHAPLNISSMNQGSSHSRDFPRPPHPAVAFGFGGKLVVVIPRKRIQLNPLQPSQIKSEVR